MEIKDIILKLNKIKSDIPSQAKKVTKEEKETILDYIREKQLFDQGVDGGGKRLKKYTPYTKALKKQKGQPTDRVTLNDTGSFYNSMDLLLTDQSSLGVFSRDDKTPDIIEKYGRGIFTLTKQHNKEVNELYKQKLFKWIFTQI